MRFEITRKDHRIKTVFIFIFSFQINLPLPTKCTQKRNIFENVHNTKMGYKLVIHVQEFLIYHNVVLKSTPQRI